MNFKIGWNKTVSWEAGDWVCRTMSFFRVFGLYLSDFVLVCISLERLIVVMQPVGVSRVKNREKVMLKVAWVASAACSLPQVRMFTWA